ncbi:MAG: type II secretion system F family protein, partial [Patescibacteria group bacterium]
MEYFKSATFQRVSRKDKLFLIKMLAVMFKAGLPVEEIFEVIIKQVEGSFKNILNKVVGDISSGASLSKAFSSYPRVFSPLFLHLISVGETSGTLDENLERLSAQFKKDYESRRKVITAATYPILILCIAVIMGFGVSFFVFPRLIPIFSDIGVELPLPTVALLFIARTMSAHGISIISSFLLFVIVFIWFMKLSFVRRFAHPIYCRLPIVGNVVRAKNLGQFSSTLHTLLKSGTSIDESLRIISDIVSNVAYKKDIENAMIAVKKGFSLGSFLDTAPQSRWSQIASRMIKVGEETGKLEETLLYTADFYDAELDEAT